MPTTTATQLSAADPTSFRNGKAAGYAIFVTNPKYWGAKPKIDQITVRFVPDDASQVAA